MHLIHVLQQNYQLNIDWEGRKFCGHTFDWQYSRGGVDVSMPNYIPQLFKKFQHQNPTSPQYLPYLVTPYVPLKKGERKYASSPDIIKLLTAIETKITQQIVGCLLYYARAIDYTILPALNTIAQSQAKPTLKTKSDCKILLDYCATYPHTILRYHASDMILNTDSDASYLCSP